MNTIGEKVIEVEVTEDDLQQLRATGVPETELPSLGIRKYRAARHLIRDKVAILLDADIVEHFKNETDADDREFYQHRINETLRNAINRSSK